MAELAPDELGLKTMKKDIPLEEILQDIGPAKTGKAYNLVGQSSWSFQSIQRSWKNNIFFGSFTIFAAKV